MNFIPNISKSKQSQFLNKLKPLLENKRSDEEIMDMVFTMQVIKFGIDKSTLSKRDQDRLIDLPEDQIQLIKEHGTN